MKFCSVHFLKTLVLHTVSTVASCLILMSAFANDAEKLPKAKLISSFPFILLDGGMIIIKASINNLPDPLNFLFDTGCGGISIDSLTAVRLNLNIDSSDRNIKGINQNKRVSFAYNQTLHLPHLAVDSLNFHINDYRFLTAMKGIEVNGVIGYNFIKRFIIKINYDSLKIEVWKPGSIVYSKKGFLINTAIDKLAFFNASIKDSSEINENYLFDTGADVCLLMSNNFVQDSNVLRNNKKMIDVPAESPGGKRNMKFTTINELQVGPYKFKKVPAYIFNDDYNVTRFPYAGGVIGNDLLHRFNLVINYPAAEVHITPNTHFSDAFDYTYTGFKLYDVNGTIVIDNIVEGSPAEKSGLVEGDIVLGINNNFSNSLNDYKSSIFTTKNKFKMSILRKNQVKNIEVIVESVL